VNHEPAEPQAGAVAYRGWAVTTPARSRLRRTVALAAAALIVPLALEWFLHGAQVERWGVATLVGLIVLGALATALLARRWRGEGLVEWAWFAAVTVFVTLGAAGAMAMAEVAETVSWPTRWDVGLALWPWCAAAGLWRHMRRYDMFSKLGFFADSALLALGATFCLWDLFISQRAVAAGLSNGEQLLLVWYLLGSLLVASVLLFLMLIEVSAARAAMLAATVLLAVGQFAFAFGGRAGGDAPYGVFVATTLLGLFAFAVSSALPGGGSVTERSPSFIRLVLVAAPICVGVWVAVWRYMYRTRDASFGTVALAFAAGLLIVVAQGSAWAQSAALAERLQRNLRALRGREHDLSSLLDELPTSVVVLSKEGRIREANAGALELTGRSHAMLQRMTVFDLLPEDERPKLAELWQRILTSDDDLDAPIFRFQHADGEIIFLEASVRLPVVNRDRVVVDLRDLTGDLEQRRRLTDAQERFRMAFHDAPTGMAMANADDGVLVDVNESMLRSLGYRRDDFVGATLESITHPDDWAFDRTMLDRAIAGSTHSYRMEKRYLRADGTVMWAMVSVSMLQDPSGPPLTLAHVEDITERRQAAERLEWAATHDELTRLPNRFRFLDQLAQSLYGAEPGSVAVLFIDLDNFKVINDSLGHAAGDQLLRSMSERLRMVVRDRDLLGRFGGDEFIVMLRDVGTLVTPMDVAERLRQEISAPLVIDGSELFVTASIGIAVAETGASTSDLLRDADAAMYRAKARGRNCVEVFAPGSHETSVLTLRTSNELRRGLDRNEIQPYFQPIVGLADGRLRGFEVLARWRHPERGLLPPEQFLPMAEETGLVAEVGAAVLRESLAHLGVWQNRLASFRDLTMAVNVSVRQLMTPEFPDIVADALAESGVSARSLWLEITETALMSDTKAATIALRDLRSLGLHLAVDDFGTGYSSLTYLKRFPVEAIKVDRSFVSGLGIDAEDSTIVEAVVNLGHSLGLTVVAEGVETPLQLSRLRDAGCDAGQGYLFGRPRPAELVESEYSLV
jgi:diguanylate cyclase (GGDEF)-like protein/PAS domain S-box-containing protein